jgi:MFS transporter, DHA2 family, multidrug resistance protein
VSSAGRTTPHVIGKEPTGIELVAVVIVLALANFLAVLDMTIANVLVPQISGSLAASTSNGTWVITAYGIAEAIMVPLTGWLAERFGPVRVFIIGIVGFAACSLLCGVATSLGMLIVFRILLGICGGPLIPLSQTLLVTIVPERHSAAALAAWSVTTILAPIIGPVIGGWIGDNWTWQWAFLFKVPLALAIGGLAWAVLRAHEPSTRHAPIDFVGLALLIVWVGALQTMLGNGQDQDWFNSSFIIGLAVVSVLGFIAFLIWELTDAKPIVNLRIYRDRQFSATNLVLALAFGAMFGGVVIVPLWLQMNLGYTATWAGFNLAAGGVTAIVAAPIAAVLITRYDMRGVACCGILLCALSMAIRVCYSDQIAFAASLWPCYLIGAGMVFVLVPLLDMSTSSLNETDVASGAGQFGFVRTLSGAIATAAVVALWNDEIRSNHAALVANLHAPETLIANAEASGLSPDAARSLLDQMVSMQSVQQATNNCFVVLTVLMLAAAALIWLSPKPPMKHSGAPPATP